MKIDWKGTFEALFKKLLNEQKHFVMQKKLEEVCDQAVHIFPA